MVNQTPLANLPHIDVKLVVADMDGTLLTDEGSVPPALWPILADLRNRGDYFVPASGRQYATLERLFSEVSAGMPFIAENGTYVVLDGEEVSSNVVSDDVVADIILRLRALVGAGELDVGVVVCGKRSAYVERSDDLFLAESDQYYAKLSVIPDLLDHGDEVLKVAVYDFGDANGTAARLADFAGTHQVVVSGEHWVDVMNQGVNKGTALAALQLALGVTPDQTVAFGDYLNDLEMLDQARWSFAMANAHPEIIARARYVAPPSSEGGVVQVLDRLLSAE